MERGHPVRQRAKPAQLPDEVSFAQSCSRCALRRTRMSAIRNRALFAPSRTIGRISHFPVTIRISSLCPVYGLPADGYDEHIQKKGKQT
jgi:hypothetical protein